MLMLGLLLVNTKLLSVVEVYPVSVTNINTTGSDVTFRLNS